MNDLVIVENIIEHCSVNQLLFASKRNEVITRVKQFYGYKHCTVKHNPSADGLSRTSAPITKFREN